MRTSRSTITLYKLHSFFSPWLRQLSRIAVKYQSARPYRIYIGTRYKLDKVLHDERALVRCVTLREFQFAETRSRWRASTTLVFNHPSVFPQFPYSSYSFFLNFLNVVLFHLSGSFEIPICTVQKNVIPVRTYSHNFSNIFIVIQVRVDIICISFYICRMYQLARGSIEVHQAFETVKTLSVPSYNFNWFTIPNYSNVFFIIFLFLGILVSCKDNCAKPQEGYPSFIYTYMLKKQVAGASKPDR